jgi:ABC-type nickel/cobalt efflux system permease component RcnA
MYHPQHDREHQQPTHRPQQGQFIRSALPVVTVMFWVGASICVAAIAMFSFTESIGAWLFWIIGVSLLIVVVSSGAIAWAEFRSNPEEDAERGEWTNKMLFYGLVFAITFFVTLLYLPALYFAP